MNRKIKKEWVAALRSEDYKQGRGCLRDVDDCFCALGVLCDIVDPDGWELGSGFFTHKETLYFPNHPVLSAAGVSNAAAGDVAARNDANQTFHQIAKYIEANL